MSQSKPKVSAPKTAPSPNWPSKVPGHKSGKGRDDNGPKPKN